jgi:cellulose synthase/poly-beta-1,6-N-acetylglucosamine synthase-like glycosyltransferase
MPVRDEADHLREAVGTIVSQNYPGPMEIVLAVAPSRDDTERVALEIAAGDTRVRIVPNPARITPAGLNLAIQASSNPIVVRVDGHGVLSPDYVRRAVELLEETGADNVGGVMDAQGRTAFEQAVARAMGSRLGIGGARFHLGGTAGPAETVYLGVFRRDVLERLGGFDEHFRRAQDWELNYRIRRDGGLVWFSPELRVVYRPRSSLPALATQFFRTGRWRREVMRRYPDSSSVRYLAAPVAVAAMLVGAVAGTAAAAGAPSWLALGWLGPCGYLSAVVAGSLAESRGMPWRARAWLPVVLATMHICWGAGFLRGPESPQ